MVGGWRPLGPPYKKDVLVKHESRQTPTAAGQLMRMFVPLGLGKT
ncbi:hypothetical protein SAMN05444920_104236 [Nonomuraea solani]|uniref:Uncharacterized protein n=1 Tax=Nonomuraea solani TaxID=1144553 RepID=A0A1H6CPV4_9ACTN|nr:hypothetical protein SAMN05444920_104236 [Nonomuraea solani]